MKATADLMVTNAAVWSGEWVRGADAIAIGDGRIMATGRASDLDDLQGSRTRRLDAMGATVTPGLTDAHLHLIAWARSLAEVDLSGCASRSEAVERVRRFLDAHPGDEVVSGGGWDDNSWGEKPDSASLDAVSGGRVLLLHSHDRHTLWANSAALRKAGIDRRRSDPEGGAIERDASGEPTGILREHAVRLFAALGAGPPGGDLDRVRSAVKQLHSLGVTAVHDFEGPEAVRVLRALVREPAARVRILANLAHATLDHALEVGLESGIGDDWFRIGSIKLFADGTLGSRTAALLSPYDGTDTRGLELIPPSELRKIIRRAFEGGLSVAIHTIGDRACRSALDGFEAVRDLIPRLSLPPRLEHVQLLDPDDLPRLARLGIAASMQPAHCTSDLDLVERYWSTRKAQTYPWRSLLASGALLAFGSDAPVEPPSPALGLHAATTRERVGRPVPLAPEQRIGLDAALSAYTTGPARIVGRWPWLGSLRPGALADLVVWDRNLHRLDRRDLSGARPVATILEGEVVFELQSGDRSAAPAASTREHAQVGGDPAS